MVAEGSPRLQKEAEAAWDRYQSVCTTGGTPEQRRFACRVAVEAEEKLAKSQLAQGQRRATSAPGAK